VVAPVMDELFALKKKGGQHYAIHMFAEKESASLAARYRRVSPIPFSAGRGQLAGGTRVRSLMLLA
jgi:hypothetical protein